MNKILHSRFGRDVFTNSIILLIAKSAGFIIPIIIARTIGINQQTDVFFFLFAFIMFFTMAVASTLEAVLVPFLVGIENKNRNIFINSLLMWSFLTLLIITVIAFLLLIPASSIVTKFNAGQNRLLINLFWESSPLVFIIIFNSIFTAELVSKKYFNQSSFSALLRALVIIITLIYSIPKFGINALPISLLFGEISKLILLVYLASNKCEYEFKIEYKIDEHFKEFINVGGFQFLSVVIVSFNPIVDKTLATWLQGGSLTIIEYAEKIYLIPITVLSLGITMVILPRWSEKFKKGELTALKSEIKKSSSALFLVSIIFIVPIVVFSNEIVSLLFGNKINLSELQSISLNAVYYLIGVPFYLVCLILIRALVASKKTKTLVLISIFRLFFNILFDIVLIYYLGIYGITLSTTINSIILLIMLSNSASVIFNKNQDIKYV